LEFTRLTDPAGIIATPSFGQHLIENCPELTGRAARELGFKRFFCAGEPGGGDPAVRKALAEGFGAKVFDHTGGGHAFHGISCDEPPEQYSGMHFVSEDHCLLELIDPESKETVAFEDGAQGEMVFTFLDWEGGPFMRYALGDIIRIFTKPCPCGFPGPRFKIVGRADDMLIVKGVNIYPNAVKNAVLSFYPEVTGVLRIVLDKPGPGVEPPLKIRIEHGAGLSPEQLRDLEARMLAHFRRELRTGPKILWLPPGSITRENGKERLVIVGGGST
jgi:phenylacetate-CoA ligase